VVSRVRGRVEGKSTPAFIVAASVAAGPPSDTPTTKTITMKDGTELTLYWSSVLGWVTIPDDDEES
jgi:hypothetical protein